MNPTPVRESYDSNSLTSQLPSESASRNVSLGRLSDEEADQPSLPDEGGSYLATAGRRGHKRLVERYLKEAENFGNLRDLDRGPRHASFLYTLTISSRSWPKSACS